MSKRVIQSVLVLVDWNSQLLNIDVETEDVLMAAKRALELTVRRVARMLELQEANLRFSVAIRLYHGWRKGFAETDRRRAIMRVVSSSDLSALARSSRVVVSPTVHYGDRLLAALDERLNSGMGIHLPNTLRQQSGKSQSVEKMVDTALAVDLLEHARQDPTGWAVVVSDDDDLVPPAFTAEAWMKPYGGRVLLFRQRRTPSQYLRLDGLLCGSDA